MTETLPQNLVIAFTVGVIGLGYVGLPLAVEFANAGFDVVGIDVDQHKVNKINAGQNYIKDVNDDDLKGLVSNGKLSATTEYRAMETIDHVRESPSFDISRMLTTNSATVDFDAP